MEIKLINKDMNYIIDYQASIKNDEVKKQPFPFCISVRKISYYFLFNTHYYTIKFQDLNISLTLSSDNYQQIDKTEAF